MTQCLKIIEKVAFNIASEARSVYILSESKLVKNAKIEKLKCDFFGDFQTLRLRCNDPLAYFLLY